MEENLAIMETTTNHDKPALLVDGYLFRLDRATANGKTWRCTKRGCPARCRTDVGNKNLQVLRQHVEHGAKNQKDIAVTQFRKACKRRCAEDLLPQPTASFRLREIRFVQPARFLS
ncbi:hypothetical protein ACOMHN_053068 [Nucella lapillus]